MNVLTLSRCCELFGGELHNANPDRVIEGFAFDSREVKPHDLFVAISGANVNGNQFSEVAIRDGATAVLSEQIAIVPTIHVSSIVDAIARFGRTLRNEFAGPVIGITGSNGKTTTKEFIAAALTPLGEIVKSPGNRNTEYSSPLVWAEVSESTRAVVVELAMRGLGQIRHLSDVHRPTIGVVTMIGTAHAELVGSREGIASAKSELLGSLPHDGAAVLWAEDVFLGNLKSKCKCPTYTFGFSPDADCKILGYRAIAVDRCNAIGSLFDENFELDLPTVGRHQILNAAASILAAKLAGVSTEASTNRIRFAKLPPMRMEVLNVHGATILLDTYNASPDSAGAAIRTLTELPCEGRRIAILGEMLELGDFTESGHRQIGRALAESRIDHILFVGNSMQYAIHEALRAGLPSDRLVEMEPIDRDNLNSAFQLLESVRPGDLVLIKGSRALGLERIVQAGAGNL